MDDSVRFRDSSQRLLYDRDFSPPFFSSWVGADWENSDNVESDRPRVKYNACVYTR